jgi:hypothetical protein
MAYSGKPDPRAYLFPADLVPEVIDLVLDSWTTFRPPAPADLEVPITHRFCAHLRRHRDRSRLPFNIVSESDELAVCTGEQLGRIDLRLVHGYRDEVYFAFECKRLNTVIKGKRSSLAGDYVDKGMMRFIVGTYGKGLDKGGMVGYVMDGKLDDAILAVKHAIDKRRAKLWMAGADSLETSSLMPKEKRVKESKHPQGGSMFVIHHIFLPVA